MGDAPNEATCHLVQGSIFLVCQPRDDSLNADSCSSHRVLQGIFVVYNGLWYMSAKLGSTTSEEHTFPSSMMKLMAVIDALTEVPSRPPSKLLSKS